MKRGLLFLTSLFMMVSIFGATESKTPAHGVVGFNNNYYSDDVIEFRERGIKFYVFLDGTFDFNTSETAEVDYVYKSRRGRRHTEPRGLRIERDYNGRIRRIGHVFINYSYRNQVKRIGSVFIKYRNRRMTSVGNLDIHYTRYGVHLVGDVKRPSHYYGYYNYNPYYSYGWSSFNDWDSWDAWEYGYYDPFFDNDDFDHNYESFDEDEEYYYYKSKAPKGKKASKRQIIKRKKATNSRRGEKKRKLSKVEKEREIKKQQTQKRR